MNRFDNMLGRLPPIYRTDSGSVLQQLLGLVHQAMATFDQDMDRVQRSRWVNHAFDRVDLAKLGELFDLPPAAWEPDALYRQRLKATIAARLRGATPRIELESVILRIIDGAQNSLALRLMTIDPAAVSRGRSAFETGTAPRAGVPVFREFPLRLRRSQALIQRRGLLRPFDQFTITHQGLEESGLEGVLFGYGKRRTMNPVLVNLTTGQVLAFQAHVPQGQALRLEVKDETELRATLDGENVSHLLRTGGGFDPTRRPASTTDDVPRPLRLVPGDNRLWFFPAALFDARSLDVGRLGTPTPSYTFETEGEARSHVLQQGVFQVSEDPEEQAVFDAAVFYEDPAVVADLWWRERTPATFRFAVPSAVAQRDVVEAFGGTSSDVDDTERQVSRVFSLLEQSVDLLRAAGVDGGVERQRLRSRQRSADRVRVVPPQVGVEDTRASGRLAAFSALFDVTASEGSRFE